MNQEEIKQQANEVFREVFGNPDIMLSDEMTSADIVGWDSFSHINLISALEIQFEIEFSRKEAIGFKSVGDLLQAIEHKLAS